MPDAAIRAVFLLLLGALTVTGAPVTAQVAKSYKDGSGETVILPMGDLSFADAAVSYDMGDPAPIEPSRDPAAATGVPDWEDLDTADRIVTLGCGGRLVLRFEDNALIDTEGTDLYVFEVGPDVEGTILAISTNGVDWIEVGEISGGRADIDIAPHVEPGATFSHVRLTDDGEDCRGRWPGADIDAVAAIGTAERFVLDGAVLFEFDSATLRDGAREALREITTVLEERDLAALRIVGHTDSRGSDQYNRALSEDRANAVRDWLSGQSALADVELSTYGAGEMEPAADNATEEGRQRNRRVEIIAVPAR